MRDFAKVYTTILDSSVWGESKDVRILWVTMLAMGAASGGRIEASVGGLARRAQLTREEVEAALVVLSSPDPDDKSGVDEGRRIRTTERGWQIVNHKYYRDFRTEAQVDGAERVARHRAKQRAVTSVTRGDVTAGNGQSRAVRPDREREEDLEQEEIPPPKDLTGLGGELPSVVVVPQSAESKVSCPADLQLNAAQRSQLTMGKGMNDYQVDELSRRFRANFTANPDDKRPLVAWRKCMAQWVSGQFGNPRHRPPQSPDEPETERQSATRLRSGPRQPNVFDHSDPEQHLAAIGATVV